MKEWKKNISDNKDGADGGSTCILIRSSAGREAGGSPIALDPYRLSTQEKF